jgi:DNA polymerase III alpha subunit
MGDNSHIAYARRKNGLEKIDYIDDELEEKVKEILQSTYGLMVYQEQVQKIAQSVANYSAERADNLRRAMGKKDRELLAEEFKHFEAGMLQNQYSPRVIKKLWNILVPFSSYAFNKAHAIGYACISYITAYLKLHHTPYFMMSVMKNVEDQEKRNLYKEDIEKNFQIKLLSPNINNAQINYSIDSDNNVIYGFDNIKSLSKSVAEAIINSRGSRSFCSIFDLMCRLWKYQCERKLTSVLAIGSIELLEKAGVFNNLPLYTGSKLRSNALYIQVKKSKSRAKEKTLLTATLEHIKSMSGKPRAKLLDIYANTLRDQLTESELKESLFHSYSLTDRQLDKIAADKSLSSKLREQYQLFGHYLEDPSPPVIEKFGCTKKDGIPINRLKEILNHERQRDGETKDQNTYGIVHSVGYANNKKDLLMRLWLMGETLEFKLTEFRYGYGKRARQLKNLLDELKKNTIPSLDGFSREKELHELIMHSREHALPLSSEAIEKAAKKDLNELRSDAYAHVKKRIDEEMFLHRLIFCSVKSYSFRDNLYLLIDKIVDDKSMEEAIKN